jgi:hypothetical protein
MTSPGTTGRDSAALFSRRIGSPCFWPTVGSKLAVSPVDGGLSGVQEARCGYGYGYADRITGPGLLGQVSWRLLFSRCLRTAGFSGV